jgi:hypothetical protein
MPSVSVPLLFQLPHAWLVAFLSEWLDMPTIGRLDSAICAKEYRPQFLNSLQNMRSTYVDGFSDDYGRRGPRSFYGREWSGRWWRWLSIRQIHAERATLIGSTVNSALAVPSIRELTIEECDNKVLVDLVASCTALRSLTILWTYAPSNEQHMADSVFERLVDLEEFNFDRHFLCCNGGSVVPDEYYEQSAAALIQMLHQSAKLKKVSLTEQALRGMDLEELQPFGHLFDELHFDSNYNNPVPATGQMISNLLTRCVNLRKVKYFSIRSTADEEKDLLALTALYQSCPLLEDVELRAVSSTVLNAVLSGLRRNCTLTHKLALMRCVLSDSCLRDIAGMESLKGLEISYCNGLTDAGMAVLVKSRLSMLGIRGGSVTAAGLQSFVGSNISHTLETFGLEDDHNGTLTDDVQVATALASCHNLKKLAISLGSTGSDECVFGRKGLDGLQAMATGCPLLTDLSLFATVPGLHFLGTHFTNLKRCKVNHTRYTDAPTPQGFPSTIELHTLYPAVTWWYYGWYL